MWRYFAPDDIHAGGGKTSVFSASDVQKVINQVELSGAVDALQRWWNEDHAGKRGGGRPRYLSDLHILVGTMLLLAEGSPLWITELGQLFWRRLSPEALVLLGLDHIKNTGVPELDRERWISRAYEAYHRLLDNIDAWPAPRRLLTLEERQAVTSLREKNNARRKHERATEFASLMIEMTIQLLPRRVRRKLSDVVSIDQTAVLAVSPRKRFGIDKTTGLEAKPEGSTHHGLVLEMDADFYPTKAYTDRVRDARERVARGEISRRQFEDTKAPRRGDLMWAYMANVSVTVPPDEATHPLLATTVTISKPNHDVANETLSAARSLVERGHQPSRFTMDQGYIKLKGLAAGLRELGVERLVDYDADQRGVRGGVGGSLQVEGAHYCAALPKHLRDATIDHREGKLSEDEWKALLAERAKYALRRKERPDAKGRYPMMCPALGPQAKIECAFRDIHPKSSKTPKPVVLEENLPPADLKPAVCRQHSITFGPDDGVEYAQALPYGSDEWQAAYSRERNAVESFNSALKNEHQNIEDPLRRRVRGRAAAHYAVVMMAVSVNIRRILRFLRDEAARIARVRHGVPLRRRDRDGLSEYARRKRRGRTRTGASSLKPPDPVPRT